MIESCREGTAFMGGLAVHFLVDAVLMPLFAIMGWSFAKKHKHKEDE